MRIATNVLVFVFAAAPAVTQTTAGVIPGVEVLLTDSMHLVRGKRVGLLTNHSGRDRQGRLQPSHYAARRTPWSASHGRRLRAGCEESVQTAAVHEPFDRCLPARSPVRPTLDGPSGPGGGSRTGRPHRRQTVISLLQLLDPDALSDQLEDDGDLDDDLDDD